MQSDLFTLIKTSLEEFDKDPAISFPPDPKFGHLSTGIAMTLAKDQNKPPQDIAAAIKKKLDKNTALSDIIEKVEIVKPGFVNFFLKIDYLLSQAQLLNYDIDLNQSLFQKAKGKTIVIDYSAPNIAKPFGIGHLRSTNIGQAIYNIW